MSIKQNMMICLINPPFDYPTDSNVNTYFNQPTQNIGVGYLASSLLDAGYQVDVIEAPSNDLSVQQCVTKMMEKEYVLLGVSCHFYNRRSTIRICNKYIKAGGSGVLFAGGILASLYPDQLLLYNTGIKFCIIGEGERTIVEFADAFSKQTDMSLIKGLAYLENGKIRKTSRREPIRDLEKLPYPHITYVSPNKMFMMTTSRGCNGNCSFCAAKHYYRTIMGGQYFCKASAQYVIKEMSILYKTYGIRFFHFCDDNFLAGCNDNWMEEFIEGLQSIGNDIKFYFYACTNDILRLKRYFGALKEVGLFAVFVGVESFIQRQLDIYNKRTTPERNIQALELLTSNGVQYNLGLMLLDPFVHLEEYIENIEVLYSLRYFEVDFPDACPVSLVSAVHLVPNSDLYKLVSAAGLLNSSELGYRFMDSKVSEFYMSTIPWQNIVQRAYKYFQFIFIYKETCKESVFKQFRREIMKIDILFLLDTATAILKGTQNISKLMEDYQNRIKALEKRIAEYV